jgi:Putative binding domain, N-terminal/Viral BACON domain
MCARNPIVPAILLAASSFSIWAQQPPLRPPGPPDISTLQHNNDAAKRQKPAGVPASQQHRRNNASWKRGASAQRRRSACTVELSSRNPLFGAGSNTAHVDVLTTPGCAWSIATTAAWLTPAAGTRTRGIGPATNLAFDIAPADPSGENYRTGKIVASADGIDQTWYMVVQRAHDSTPGAPNTFGGVGKPCSNPVPLLSQSLVTDPSTGAVTGVSQPDNGSNFPAKFADALPSCTWKVQSLDPWLSTNQSTASSSDNTPADVKYQSQPGTNHRYGTLWLQGQIDGNTATGVSTNDVYLYVEQFAPAQCNYSLSFSAPDIPATGGQFAVQVGTQNNPSCQWQLQASDAWISLGPSPSGSGDQSFNFTIQPNPGSSTRTGTISIQGNSGSLPVTITQNAVSCTYQLSAPSTSLNFNANSGSFQVTTQTGCTWTAASSDTSWLTIASGQGPGNGVVSFNAAANTGLSARSASIGIQGQNGKAATFIVNQGSQSCSYSLSGSSLGAPADGVSSGLVGVNAPSGCRWTATANPAGSWINLTNSFGIGSDNVTFSLAANNTPNLRTGYIYVQDQTFTITQPAGVTCDYSLSTNTINAPASGGRYPVQISTSNGCQWTVQSNANWTAVDAASGNTTGTVNVSVAANNSTSSRTATVSVNSYVITVNQSAADNPPNASFSANPNPVPVACGQPTGTTTFSWNATGVSGVRLYAGSTSGTLLYQGPASGTYTSSSVTDGEIVVLADTNNTVLALVTVSLASSCGTKLLQAVVTDQTSWTNGACAMPKPKAVFTGDDTTATFWFKLQNVPTGATIMAQFIDPNGDPELYQSFNVTANAPQYCNASIVGVMYDYPDGFVPATLPGQWTVQLSVNGNVVGAFPYYISAPLTYAWTFTSNIKSDPNEPELNPPFANGTKSLDINNDSLNVYFSTINSQAGDVNHIYVFRWDAGANQWVFADSYDFDPLDVGGVWFFWYGLGFNHPSVQQNPGYWGVVGSVTQGNTETVTFQEIFTITPTKPLQATPSSLNFTYQVGNSVPPAQSVAITSTPAGAGFTMSVANRSAWLGTHLTNSTTPATLYVSMSPAGLIAGTYSDSIVLTSPSGTVKLPVSLTVSAPGPALTSISPASASALSGNVALQANGQNLTPDARVHWIGPGGASTDLQTQFQNAALLQATIPASLLTSPGTAQISVINSVGSSNTVTFQITTPTPLVTSVTPASLPVNSPQTTLAVNGSNFINGAQVTWKAPNGSTSPLQTQFQNSTLLQATLPASYLTSPGTASVGVSNAGVASNTASFQITASVSPQISMVSPSSVASSLAGDPGNFKLMVYGSNFSASTSVYWNGKIVPTTYFSPTLLSASIPGSYFSSPQSATVTVSGGGFTSNAKTVSVTAAPAFKPNPIFMTSSAQPSGSCGDPDAANAFVKSDGSAYLYFLATVSLADNLGTDFVAPDGTVVNGIGWANNNGYYCFYSGLNIANIPSNQLGAWQARVYDNGSLAYWLQFTVTTASISPQISTVSPSSVASSLAGDPGNFNLMVYGSNFSASTGVYWNGKAVPTVYISPALLSALIPGSYFSSPQSATVTVSGGGSTSNAKTVSVTAAPAFKPNPIFMTKSAQPSGSCGNPAAANAFLKRDGSAYLYFLATVTLADNLGTDFVAPDGTVVNGIGWANNNGYYCFYSGLNIANTPSNQLGAWQARVYDNGSLVYWLSLTVN